ncbi:MAG: phosphatidylserine decarboxylase [Poseidonia sp.]
MAGLAPGGHAPVLTMTMMGVSALVIGSFIDPLAGLVPLFGMLCLMGAVFLGYFWRDPDRPVPRSEGVLVSPADGHAMFLIRERAIGRRPTNAERDSATLEEDALTGEWYPEPLANPLAFTTEQRFERVPPGEESSDDVWRLAVFMSPLDVHVNRAPDGGVIERIEHRTGKGRRRGPFRPAYTKESEFNERVRSVHRLANGHRIELTQISGALARTIVPFRLDGEQLRRGQRIGMIRLGSRVDLRVPAEHYHSSIITAADHHSGLPKGQHVLAGTTVVFEPITREEA